jgi:uncharacterized protein
MVTAYFLDSSALLKRYIPEMGTAWIQSLTSQSSGHVLLISRITFVEILSAIARRQRETSLTPTQAQQLRSAFKQHFASQYQVVELTSDITILAGELCDRQSLRAYDAVQLASAMSVSPIIARSPETTLTFLTADDRLLAAARLENFDADNPNHHSDLVG